MCKRQGPAITDPVGVVLCMTCARASSLPSFAIVAEIPMQIAVQSGAQRSRKRRTIMATSDQLPRWLSGGRNRLFTFGAAHLRKTGRKRKCRGLTKAADFGHGLVRARNVAGQQSRQYRPFRDHEHGARKWFDCGGFGDDSHRSPGGSEPKARVPSAPLRIREGRKARHRRDRQRVHREINGFRMQRLVNM
jgi:hypothetical protein